MHPSEAKDEIKDELSSGEFNHKEEPGDTVSEFDQRQILQKDDIF